MRMLPVIVLVGAVVFGGYVSAQDTPVVVTKPIYTPEAFGGASAASRTGCRVADETTHPVTTVVAFGGRQYRCVTVLDENFNRAGAAWTPVQQP